MYAIIYIKKGLKHCKTYSSNLSYLLLIVLTISKRLANLGSSQKFVE